MARSPRIPPVVKGRVLELRRTGRIVTEIQSVLAAEGHKVSVGWIHNVLSEPPKASPPAVVAPPPSKPDAESVDLEEALPLLARSVAAIESLAASARAAGTPALELQAQRALTGAIALMAKLKPPPVQDHNQHPDMVAAAEKCKEKLRDLVARAVRA